MRWFTPARKVTLGLVLLTFSLLLLAELIGLVPNEQRGYLDGRRKFSESLAVQFSVAASRGEFEQIRKTLELLVEREEDMLSAALRRSDGRVLAVAGDHAAHWIDLPLEESTPQYVKVPIFAGQQRWGTLEVAFARWSGSYGTFSPRYSLLPLAAFMLVAGFLVYLYFITRTLRELDPRSVIPERVKSAFDALAEGLVLMDEKEQVILANSAFAERIGRRADDLLGRKLSYMAWDRHSLQSTPDRLPWQLTLSDGKHQIAVPLKFDAGRDGVRTFMVNTTAISNGKGALKGVLATFDDYTDLERKQLELKQTIEQLQNSQDSLRAKTVELEYLAMRDPLTGCLNRRSFFDKGESLFAAAKRHGKPLVCVMIDIDHFKSINDHHGHVTGDKVIQLIANTLRTNARPDDLVGRYGGEEFCMLLPGVALDAAEEIAERHRLTVKNTVHAELDLPLRITASFGYSGIFDDVETLGELVNRADRALYRAKETGRNRVVRCDSAADWYRNWSTHGIPQPYSSIGSDAGADVHAAQADDACPATPDDGRVGSLEARIAELEEELNYSRQAFTEEYGRDALTGLPNRLLFRDRIGQALARGQRFDNIAAVVILSIDVVERVNDALGTVIGDRLLRKAAERLSRALRGTDTIAIWGDEDAGPTLSRTGADEFGILLTDLKDADMVTWIVKRMLDSLTKRVTIDGNDLYLQSSAGISLFPHDGDTADALIQCAGAARHVGDLNSGSEGPNRFRFYSEDINRESCRQLWFESQLHRALDNDEFSLHYQPKVNLATGRITCMEALIRWQNPKLGAVSPIEFIPIAERTGSINAIGQWVIETACRDAREWVDAGYSDVAVAVNLSALQIRHSNIQAQVVDALSRNGLSPGLLELEITESSILSDTLEAPAVLKSLHAVGVGVAIDDFGTGYSSLSYLKHLPVHTLKIDRSFLSEAVPDQQDEMIITAIIAMAHSMGLTVVAEGVENQAQKSFLANLGCDEIQGYLISKPVQHADVHALLRSHNGVRRPQTKPTLTA